MLVVVKLAFMAVRAVIFDWGGTLTPWDGVDRGALWQQACASHYPAEQAAAVAAALLAAENGCWTQCETEHSSATLARIFSTAGVSASAHEAFIETYFGLWEPHTYTDPDVAPLLRLLRERSIKVGVLSNTVWPRALHERVFRRDGVLELIDGAVYSSEIPWTKPHPEAFRAAMAAVGVSDPSSCVFVGDRPFDDIYGAGRVGMRTVFVPHSGLPSYAGSVPDAVISRLAELPALLDQWLD
jgi:putative hydrolase of the HAD superfamily